jgi:phosphohistidine swiveling domain-containing protein
VILRSLSDLGGLPFGGGKSRSLAELSKIGLPTAQGFAVDIETSQITDYKDQLEKEIEKIGGYPLVVRSSGNLEDDLETSFAGQLDSVVNVKNWSEFKLAVESVLKSVEKPSFLSYLVKNKIRIENFKMYVLVQNYIKHEVSGIAFTMHPMSGLEEVALVECHRGEAEDLVSGKVSPVQVELNIFDSQPVVSKKILSPNDWNTFKDHLRNILRLFGRPQDIEWGWSEQSGFCIFQSRPMTTFSWRTDFLEMTNADFRDGGVSARPSIPIMYSLYKTAYENGLESYLKSIGLKPFYRKKESWLEFQYGRIYWNSNKVKTYLKKLPDFDERNFDENLGVNKSYPQNYQSVTPVNLKSLLSAVPVILLFPKEIKSHNKQLSVYRSWFKEFECDVLKSLFDLGALSDENFQQWFLSALEKQEQIETFYCRTISNSTMMQSVLQERLLKIEKVLKYKIDMSLILSHITGVAHFESQDEIVSLYEKHKESLESKIHSDLFKLELNKLLKKHYYRSFAELDLMQTRWFEEPESVYNLFLLEQKSSAPNTSKLVDYLTKLKCDYLENNPSGQKKFSAFEQELEASRRLLVAREEVRQTSSKAYTWVRMGLRELGSRIVLKNILITETDVFFCNVQELRDLITDKESEEKCIDSLADKIENRKLKYQAFKQFEAPNEFGSALNFDKIQTDVIDRDPNLIRGLACSPGVYEGTARFISDPRKMMELEDGEILITKFTDPGWTPVLGVAKAVVTEVGGMLSHAAVISREYGIPAVLNVGPQILKIKTGQKIRVDGSAGTIHLL